MFFLMVTLAVVTNVLYHVASKSIPRRAKRLHGTCRQLRNGTHCKRDSLFPHVARKNFSRGVADKLGVHFDGLVDNGRGGGVRDDLSVGRRIVDGITNREHFTRVGNAFRRRSLLSRTNHLAKNFRRNVLYRGRDFVVAQLNIRTEKFSA